MKELTKAEEQIMQILWQLKEAMVKDIIEQMPAPKPAYNTVSTIIRVLEGKGLIHHKAYGNSNVYFPTLTAADYKSFTFDKMMTTYFSNSYKSLLSYLVKEKDLTVDELQEITDLAEKLKNKN